jgi:hypothetical protein
MLIYGFESAFLPWRDKQALVAQVRKQLGAVK